MNDGKETINCETCAFCVERPDMKNISYCVIRNFAIYCKTCPGCSKYKRRKKL